jgi:protein-S-isoprenylcysteine O-methyltransferase Ste14
VRGVAEGKVDGGPGLRLIVEAIAFTILVPGTVTIWLPRDVLGVWGDLTPSPWTNWQFAALSPLVLGLLIYARCAWEFAARGRGIPAPIDHPKQLVVSGLYRYVRNPMYLGVLLVLLGEALFLESLPFLQYTLIWFVVVHVFVLAHEEPHQRHTFCES